MKVLESIEITVRRTSKPREKWGPFQNTPDLLAAVPFNGEIASYQIVVKVNGGYGRNHETGSTAIINFRGELDKSDLLNTLVSALHNYGSITLVEAEE